MLLTSLVKSTKLAAETLSDTSDEDVTNILRLGIMVLSARMGVKFTITGSDWTTWDINNPVVTDDLSAIMILQTKQVANGSSGLTKAKVGSLTVEYDPKAWQRDEQFLEKLIDAYAFENDILLPSSLYVITSTEYDVLLNSNIVLNTINRYYYNNIWNWNI